jgi:hypothetical protein
MNGSTACLAAAHITTVSEQRHAIGVEIAELESAQVWSGWYRWTVALGVASTIAFVAGLALDNLDRCGIFGGGCVGFDLSETASKYPGTLALWGGGAVGVLSSIFLFALVSRLRESVDERLESLRHELGTLL